MKLKILPYTVLGLLGLLVITPIIGSMNGSFWGKSPKISNQTLSCQTNQKDPFGRCPPPGKSNFRYLSTGSSGGRSGGGGGGK